MKITLGRGDLLAGQPITPGWYKVHVDSAKNSSKRKTNVLDGIVEFSFLEGQLKADERTVQHTFFAYASDGIGFIVPYAAAILGKTSAQLADELDEGQELDFDFEESVGHDLYINIDNETYQGRVLNKVKAFLPINVEPVL